MKVLSPMIMAVVIGLASLQAQADNWSSSNSLSCSGSFEGEYSYAYAYQYVYVVDGYIKQEQHQFQFQGKLKSEKFVLRNLSGPHVIYESNNYFLAVPYQSGDSLMIRSKFRRDDIRGPGVPRGSNRNQWEVLCEK